MQTIVFTGARSGIQAKVIDKLKEKDYQIYVTVHNEKQLQLVKEYYKENKNIHCLKLDVTVDKDRKKLEDIEIDILISNAAIGIGGSLAEIPMDFVRDNFETNVFSYFTIIQIVLKKMIQKGKGKIINMASLAGILPIPYLGSYCATKASIIKMTECLKQELHDLHTDIQVCLIEPGLYHTGFNQVMLDNKYKRMELDSYFKNHIQQIQKRENLMCWLFEKRNLDSIVKKIIRAIEDSNVRAIYRAPFLQVLGTKIYMLFFE